MSLCPCGSGLSYAECCEPAHSGAALPKTAEALMRSRYSAYAKGAIQWLGDTLHPSNRGDWDEGATRRWAEQSEWLGLEVVATEQGAEDDAEGFVEFVATFKEKGATRKHHERARFQKKDGRWFYLDGTLLKPETLRHEAPKVGRNDPCPCGSGKKYKKCCGA